MVAPTIALLQFLFYGIKTELNLLPPMGIMLIGVAIATLTELKPSILGLSVAFLGILMTAIYQIVSSCDKTLFKLFTLFTLFIICSSSEPNKNN